MERIATLPNWNRTAYYSALGTDLHEYAPDTDAGKASGIPLRVQRTGWSIPLTQIVERMAAWRPAIRQGSEKYLFPAAKTISRLGLILLKTAYYGVSMLLRVCWNKIKDIRRKVG